MKPRLSLVEEVGAALVSSLLAAVHEPVHSQHFHQYEIKRTQQGESMYKELTTPGVRAFRNMNSFLLLQEGCQFDLPFVELTLVAAALSANEELMTSTVSVFVR